MKEGWEYKKLGEVCKILNGFAFKSSKYVEKGIRVIRITNVQKGSIVDNDPKYYPFEEEPNIKQYLLSDNDLLMSLTGNVGRVGILQQDLLPAALNQRVACLRITSNNLLLKYLFHILNSDGFEKDCIFNAAGIAQKNMSTEWLKKYIVPLPPLSEQQHIVEELDLLSSIIEKKKAQLNELDNLAQSLFYEMFGDPITNEKGWEVKKLGEICNYSKTRIGSEELSVKNYVGVENLLQKCEGKIDAVKVPEGTGLTEYIIGDVLIGNIRPYLKKIWLASYRGGCNGDVLVIRRLPIYQNTVNPIYLFKCLSDNAFFDYDMQFSKGEKMPRGDKKEILKYPILMPPTDLQNQFASKIEVIEHQKELIKQSIKEVETLFNSRMDYYFN